MIVKINGSACDLPEGTTVAAWLTQRGLKSDRLAVEINLKIVPKSLYASTLLGEGDTIEVVGFVGGG